MTHTRFGRDTTIRLSCRAGDYLLWCSPKGVFSDQYNVNDTWQLKDGDFITITNRHADLPPWFKLHPRETAGVLAMRLYGGKQLSLDQIEEPIVDGPNIWRAVVAIGWYGLESKGQGLNLITVFSQFSLLM